MSFVRKVLTSMRTNCVYRPCDLTGVTQMEVGEVAKTLKILEQGGMIELIKGDEYKRKKMYKTKQMQMAI